MRAIVLLLLVSLAASEFQPNIEKAITRIKGAIAETKAHPPDFTVLPAILDKILPCLANLGAVKVVDNHLPEDLTHYIESISPKSLAQDLQKINWTQISNVKAPYQLRAIEDWDDWRQFMQTAKFLKIHNYLWKNDNNIQFKKILNFIERAGYPELFNNIKRFYTNMGRNDLIADISGTIFTSRHHLEQSHTRSLGTSGFPFVTLKSNTIYAEDDGCPDLFPVLLEVIQMAAAANLIQLLNVVLYVLQEVLGNPAMHVLMVNIGEPATGQVVHELFLMPEMKEFVPLLEHLVFSDDGIAQLNEIVKLAVGLDLSNPTIFVYVINLVQYLIWGISFP